MYMPNTIVPIHLTKKDLTYDSCRQLTEIQDTQETQLFGFTILDSTLCCKGLLVINIRRV
jgi:hypothetical protein